MVFSKMYFCCGQNGFVLLVLFLYSICVPGYFLKFSLQLSSLLLGSSVYKIHLS